MKNPSIAILIIAVAIVAGLIGFNIKKVAQAPKQMACTMEAKMCDDGSAVGRTGPNCEFAECPNVVNKGSTDKVLLGEFNQPIEMLVGEHYAFVEPKFFLNVYKINDGRCPADVMCIWQGEIQVTIGAYNGSVGAGMQDITLGTVNNKTASVSGYLITLNSATKTSATITVQQPGTIK